MSKQRIPPFQTISPFSPTPPFLEKIFHHHPYCQIRRSRSPSPPLQWGGGQTMYGKHSWLYSA